MRGGSDRVAPYEMQGSGDGGRTPGVRPVVVGLAGFEIAQLHGVVGGATAFGGRAVEPRRVGPVDDLALGDGREQWASPVPGGGCSGEPGDDGAVLAEGDQFQTHGGHGAGCARSVGGGRTAWGDGGKASAFHAGWVPARDERRRFRRGREPEVRPWEGCRVPVPGDRGSPSPRSPAVRNRRERGSGSQNSSCVVGSPPRRRRGWSPTAAISAGDSSNPKRSRFSRWRPASADLGMGTAPSCVCQRSTT